MSSESRDEAIRLQLADTLLTISLMATDLPAKIASRLGFLVSAS
jgi:hypothetical protein